MLTIYLDTSDYAELYKDNATQEIVEIRNRLFGYVGKKQIRIGSSFIVIFELLQDYEPAFLEDRRRRARMVSRLCGSNSFPFLTDLLDGQTFSSDGAWMPREALKIFNFSKLQEEFKNEIMAERRLNREQRRKLSNSSLFAALLKENPNLLKFNSTTTAEFPLPESFIAGDYMRKFFVGEVSEQEANRELRKCITDPESFFEFWFQFYKKKNPLEEMFGKGLQTMKSGILKFQSLLESSKAKASDYKQQVSHFRASERNMRQQLSRLGLSHISRREKLPKAPDFEAIALSMPMPESMKKWPLEIRIFLWEYILTFVKPRNFQDSDMIDIMHAFYLPHCDLWRGDRAFCNLLLQSNIPYKSRIVPSLKLLPSRIEEALKKIPH